jgi:cell division protein FtsQ
MNKTVKNIILRVAMLLGLIAFFVLVVLAKINRNNATIKQVNIGIDEWNGNAFVSKTQVLSLISDNFDVINKNLSGKELENIEKSIKIIPQVKKSDAYTDANGNLNIKIEQRVPIFRVYNLQGQTFYVDEDGIKFPTSLNYTAKVPIITGNISEVCDTNQHIKSVELNRVYKVIQTINKNRLWQSMIGQYNINEKKQIELIPRFGSCTIIFGDDKNIEQKLKRLDIFYFDVLKKIGWNHYKVINIMYKNQVVCLK